MCLRTVAIALASVALLIRITPEIGLAFITLASTETGPAPTLSIVRIALVVLGAYSITIARFASFAAGNLPMIRNTKIAPNAGNVRQTRTLAAESIAMLNGAVGAQNTAIALATILHQRVAEESVTTVLASVARRFVQTAHALACVQIAITALR